MSAIRKFSHRDQQRDFNGACDWPRSVGLHIDSTRVAEYRLCLKEIADAHQGGTIDALMKKRSFPVLVNAIVQAAEIQDICDGLRTLPPDPQLAERLKTFVGGAVMLSDETAAGTRPRNIGFELSVAATAAAAGLPIDLRPPADVIIPLQPHPFHVECKRPFAGRKIPNRIRHGLNQLIKRYAASDQPDQARGILAVSISKTENDGSAMLQGSSESELATTVDNIFARFIMRYKRHWAGADKRTLAVMLELRTPCVLEDPSLLIVARHFAFSMMCDPGSPDRSAFDAIAVPLQAQNTR